MTFNSKNFNCIKPLIQFGQWTPKGDCRGGQQELVFFRNRLSTEIYIFELDNYFELTERF